MNRADELRMMIKETDMEIGCAECEIDSALRRQDDYVSELLELTKGK